MFLIMKSGIFS